MIIHRILKNIMLSQYLLFLSPEVWLFFKWLFLWHFTFYFSFYLYFLFIFLLVVLPSSRTCLLYILILSLKTHFFTLLMPFHALEHVCSAKPVHRTSLISSKFCINMISLTALPLLHRWETKALISPTISLRLYSGLLEGWEL